ncbi:MAG TPA: response regulator [Pyrinomonadaceae bacterium]|jgi:CheY-like chemotaxis protein
MSGLILIADNDPYFLKSQKRFLEKEGFHVIPAGTVAEAQRIIERGGVDVAILDIRLRDDGDERDISGLSVARKCDFSIPKIILTNHPTIETVREALSPSEDGRPIAEDLIDKGESRSVSFLDKLRRIIARRKSDEQIQTLKQMQTVVGEIKRLIGNPVLYNYRGFVCMTITGVGSDEATQRETDGRLVFEGDSCRVMVWLQPNEPENVFSEALNITDGEKAEKVDFDVVLDSDTIKFPVDRRIISVHPNVASEHFDFTFSAPSTAGEHEVWAKVFQRNMLIQIVKGAVRVAAKED